MARSTQTITVRRRKRGIVRLSFAAVLLAMVCSHTAVNQARSDEPKRKAPKLDRVLQRLAARGDDVKHRVIVRTRHNRAAAVADRLAKHGDHVESQHARIDAFTATVHGADLSALVADPDVDGVSVDAVITSHADVKDSGQVDTPDNSLLLTAL